MRAFRVAALAPLCGVRQQGTFKGSPPPRTTRQRFGVNTQSEPELVASVLQHFPKEHTWAPISKWVTSIPEDVVEALVPFGGLGKFAESQPNFFVVRMEGGVKVAGLSVMAHELYAEQLAQQKQQEKLREKRLARSSRSPRRYQPRIQ